MTHFRVIYTEGHSEPTMKPESLPICDAWLIKVANRVILCSIRLRAAILLQIPH